MIRIEFTNGSYLDCSEINVVDCNTMICDDKYVKLEDLEDVERIYEVNSEE